MSKTTHDVALLAEQIINKAEEALSLDDHEAVRNYASAAQSLSMFCAQITILRDDIGAGNWDFTVEEWPIPDEPPEQEPPPEDNPGE